MINAILLLVNPAPTWKRLASQNPNGWLALVISLLPLMILSCGFEAWAMTHFESTVSGLASVQKVPAELATRYATTYVVFSLVSVLLGAFLIWQMAQGMHIRQTFNLCLVLSVYSTAPVFIIRLLDAWGAINTWIVLAIAVCFIFGTAYSGVPNLIKPDPAKAFGLLFAASVVLAICHAAVHALSYMVLQERLFPKGLGLGFLGF